MTTQDEAVIAAALAARRYHDARHLSAVDASLLGLHGGLSHPPQQQQHAEPHWAPEPCTSACVHQGPQTPHLAAPTPIRPQPQYVLGSGVSAFKPTAAALQRQAALSTVQPPFMPGLQAAVGLPPGCVGVAAGTPSGKPRFEITATCANSSAAAFFADPNYLDLLHKTAAGFLGMPPLDAQYSHALITAAQHGFAAGAAPAPWAGGSATRLAPTSMPATPPSSPTHVRDVRRLTASKAMRSLNKGPRSPPLHRSHGGVVKARSPTLPERMQCRAAVAPTPPSSSRATSSSSGGGAHASPASSGSSGNSSGTSSGSAGATSHACAWSEEEKSALLALVLEMQPCGATEWEALAQRIGSTARGGASAERMYRTLADPHYQKAKNRHGCRLNPRDGTPMHVMVEFALERLPGGEGTIDAIARVIESNPEFAKQLDKTARPGTKTYPRWKDTLLGCFKAGRYKHLANTHCKGPGGKNIYRLVGVPPGHRALQPASGGGAAAATIGAGHASG